MALKAKRILITGATNGIGKQAALQLAKMGASIVIVGRNKAKTRKVSEDIKTLSGNEDVDMLLADLSKFDDIRHIAAEFLDRYDRLDVLLNNAGAAFPNFQLSEDGYEMTFALNHFSYYILTNLLLDTLQRTAETQGNARIVNVSSMAHTGGGAEKGLWLDDMRSESGFRGFGGFGSYSASKLANILFTYELARRLESTKLTVNAVHPGIVRTGLVNSMSGILNVIARIALRFAGVSADKGAETLVYLASSPDVAGITGKYWADKQEKRTSDISYDLDEQHRLWQYSARATGLG